MLNWKYRQQLVEHFLISEDETGVRRKAFDDYLLKINKALSYVQFELRGCRNQYDGQVYYGVVNNVSDEESKLGTTYSVAQIAFYKAIVSHELFVTGLKSL